MLTDQPVQKLLFLGDLLCITLWDNLQISPAILPLYILFVQNIFPVIHHLPECQLCLQSSVQLRPDLGLQLAPLARGVQPLPDPVLQLSLHVVHVILCSLPWFWLCVLCVCLLHVYVCIYLKQSAVCHHIPQPPARTPLHTGREQKQSDHCTALVTGRTERGGSGEICREIN